MENKDSKFNLKRKLWHLLGLIIPLLLYLDVFRFVEPENPHITRFIGMYLILIFLIFLLIVELIRLNHEPFNQFFIRVTGPLLKKSEYHQIHGSISYILANFLLFLFFTKEVIAISCLILMISDPIAAYFGIYYGKIKFKSGKTLEGAVAFFISSFVVSLLFLMLISFIDNGNSALFLSNQNILQILILLTLTSFFTTLIEFFSFTALMGLIDDNLTIPLTAAITISFFGYILGFPINSIFSPLI
jgi:dolichol kinase